MKTAVVILNWNGARMLQKFLPSVIKYSQEAEVWVADNASTDNSMEILQNDFPTVKTLVLDKNYGFAEGYNRSLKQIEADYYVLLNSDVEVTENWLQPLTDYMERHPEVSAVQPKLLKYFDTDSQLSTLNSQLCFEYAGAAGGFIDKYGYPYCRGRIFGTVEEDHGQYDTPMEVHWATGACMVIRSKDYWETGGLDGRFFAHNEEIDLCWRLRIMGKKIMCLPESKVYHVGGGTLPQGNPRKTYLNFRNNLTMLYKNLPEDSLKSVFFVRTILDYIAMLQSLLTGKTGDVKAIIKARKDFHHWKHDFTAERTRIQSQRVLPPTKDLTPVFLLWQYYVKGKKKFAKKSSYY